MSDILASLRTLLTYQSANDCQMEHMAASDMTKIHFTGLEVSHRNTANNNIIQYNITSSTITLRNK